MIDPLRPGFWRFGRTCAGLPRPRSDSALGRLDMRRRYAATVRFGPGAAAAAVRLHNRRLASVLSCLGRRSSILGQYSALDCCRIVLVKCLGGLRAAV